MLQWFSFGITSLAIVCLSLILWKTQKQTTQTQLQTLEILSASQSRQIQMNQTLTNLLLSKEPMTFQQLQAGQSVSQQFETLDQVSPLDDEAAAISMMERYAKSGIDPNLALNRDDGVGFGQEFGL